MPGEMSRSVIIIWRLKGPPKDLQRSLIGMQRSYKSLFESLYYE